MRRAILAGTGLALMAGLIAACAAGSSKMAAAPASQSPQSDAVMPGDPRAEIGRLSADIDHQLAQMGVATAQAPACLAAGNCSAVAMAVTPIAEDPTCKPAKTEACDQSCTLSTSICDNAAKICNIADQLGKADAYANEKCQSGNESCSRAHERCCGCT